MKEGETPWNTRNVEVGTIYSQGKKMPSLRNTEFRAVPKDNCLTKNLQ